MKKFRLFSIIALLVMMLAGADATAQTLRSSGNSYLGKIERDGTVRSSSNSYRGKIERDGTIRNSSNSYMGKIESDGTVRNSSNSCIGKMENVDRRWAALFFFFDFF